MCHAYTTMMEVVYDLLRLHGEQMSFYIDDRIGAAHSQAVADYRSFTGAYASFGLWIPRKFDKAHPKLHGKPW